ncbi:fused MFS/spermidine synthase [Myxococcus sp. K38C18041901]|uniref:fused MFS/spermidine synthase n=1 Tax=Myxococcus guangdongensis TaxID=2906760 RepID=UPI0020A754B5|nr:fused MFS/spermidine synthase [Myxococcus guangdongensis]MCP3064347.1 fused MFS/spermidine synthase [Myxococcus guangdongensis]
MISRVSRVAPLLFGSGLCALVYQTVWLREFRLIFGASTAASAAVLAMFMAGLGLGGVLLGARADRNPRPLNYYANLELLIAVSAGLSPFLVELARAAYIGVGGTPSLGLVGGSVARLVLSTLVLAVPTVLMGGTLPAAARAVQSDEDPARRHLAILYGVNTLGAVTGATLSTFFMLEVYGNRTTLWIACLLNAAVAICARSVSRSMEPEPTAAKPQASTEPQSTEAQAGVPAPVTASVPVARATPTSLFALVAALLVGFSFLLMELVWYRMLGPILGGTTFTFGLILAVALLGIGLGGAAYSIVFRHRPATLSGFALTCAAEAAFIALPFALGDRLAVFAALLRPLGGVGFGGMMLGWALVGAVVILPAAFISGVQFPLLLALVGKGGQDVGRQVGQVYAWNTVGSIVGSLAGGFGVIPLLTAPVTWQLVAGILAVLGLASAALSLKLERRVPALFVPSAIAVLALLLLSTQGPTAAWRHGSVGAGRAALTNPTLNHIDAWVRSKSRGVVWEKDGVESSVALNSDNGLSFIVNGKSDGNAIGDAPTQVMSGLLGALFHQEARNSLIIGLGTGSTAGWMGAVPSMERVDVVEIEPAILDVARRCEVVNQKVMDNPKVHTFIADAREVLLTTRQRYDIIFSEPSNPYRAGISSLFTRDFYQAVKERLAEGGIFIQWLQAYEVDALTVQSAYATLASEFEAVETWQVHSGDLLLVATRKPLVHDVDRMRTRIAEEPYRSALRATWRTDEVEGVLARFVAGPAFTAKVAEESQEFINTDDVSFMEFAFARSLGRDTGFSIQTLWSMTNVLGTGRPDIKGQVDWDRVAINRAWYTIPLSREEASRAIVKSQVPIIDAFNKGQLGAIHAHWKKARWEPVGPREQLVLARVLASVGDEEALKYLEPLRATLPVEADLLEGVLRMRQRKLPEAAALFERGLVALRTNPWPAREVTSSIFPELAVIARADKALGRKLVDVLAEPFAADSLTVAREETRVELAKLVDWMGLCVSVLEPIEPFTVWDSKMLDERRRCYEHHGHPLALRAEADLERLISQAPAVFMSQTMESPVQQASDAAPTPAAPDATAPGQATGTAP